MREVRAVCNKRLVQHCREKMRYEKKRVRTRVRKMTSSVRNDDAVEVVYGQLGKSLILSKYEFKALTQAIPERHELLTKC